MRARLDEYEGYHRSGKNELCHFLGIPSIIVGAAAILAQIPFVTLLGFRVTGAELVSGAVAAFYVLQARWLGIATACALGLLVFAGRRLPWTLGLALFAVGWALQLVGHTVYEKRSPAFLRNLLHLLVGPAWLVERAFGRI
jgi:uncharacterized membrane protein YGL010W